MSVKRIGYAVKVLTLKTFAEDMLPHRKEYFVTRKADGARAFIINHGNRLIALTDEVDMAETVVHTLHDDDDGGVAGFFVLEAEAVNGVYYVYDVLIHDGAEVVSKPLRERMTVLEGIVHTIGCPPVIVTKQHIHVESAPPSEIASLYHDVEQSKCDQYHMDGLIFTQDAPYYQASVWKWKLAQQSTIDVALVPYGARYIACACINRIIGERMFFGGNTVPPDVQEAVTRCFAAGAVEENNRGGVVADKTVHIPLWHPFVPELFYVTFDKDVIGGPVICELAWSSQHASGGFSWHLVRPRTDKTRANNYQTCWECIWQVMFPLDLKDVLGDNSASCPPTATTPPVLQVLSDVKKGKFLANVLRMKNNNSTCVVAIGCCSHAMDVLAFQNVGVKKLYCVDSTMTALQQVADFPSFAKLSKLAIDLRVVPLIHHHDPEILANQIISAVTSDSVDVVISNFSCQFPLTSFTSLVQNMLG
eukprot:PhF_6_TR5657/c3_g1_i3/m.8303